MKILGRKPQRYDRGEIRAIKQALEQARQKGLLAPTIPGKYMDVSYRGTGDPISSKWNIQVYEPSNDPDKRLLGQSVVCIDPFVLDRLMNHGGEGLQPSKKAVIVIDDSGWGFPLCGVMVGATDGDRVVTDVVPIRFFRHDTQVSFRSRAYLHEYARKGQGLVQVLGGTPSTHRIEICTGYVNSILRVRLRECGYEVRVVEVTGLLQDSLEEMFREYVARSLGEDVYYDPKAIDKDKVPMAYDHAVKFGRERCPHLLKTGWEGMSDER